MTDHRSAKQTLRSAFMAGAAAAVLLCGAAHAQAPRAIDLGGTAMEPALLKLADQTGQQIFFPKTLVDGLKAPKLQGRFTPEQALAQLLAGTDLHARRVRDDLIVIEGATDRVGGGASERSAPAGEGAMSTRPFEVATAEPPAVVSPAAPLVDELVVTGSNIRGVRGASPVVALSRDDLVRTGQTTIAGALRALPQNFGGGAGEGANTTGADRLGRNGSYATGLNLRGLGNNATLVLVNGRRVAGSGSFGDFADVSAIPTAAVERVEVLLDGASAIYGSDAVGGVVNIILRKDLDLTEARVLAGGATAGGAGEGQASFTVGRRWATGSVLFAYELQRREALAGADRDFAASADLRPFGGSDQRQSNAFPGNIVGPDPVTGATVPRWAIPAGQNGLGLRPGDFQAGAVNLQNPREGIDLIPRQTLNAGYLALRQEVGDRLELTADARLSSRLYRLRSPAQTSTFVVTSANPFFVSPNGAASNTVAYSFVGDLPNPISSGSAETLTLTGGGTLRLAGDWRAQGYVAFGQEIDEARTGGALNSAFLSEALGSTADRPETAYRAARDGYFNPFSGVAGSNPAAVTSFMGSGFTLSRVRNRVTSASLQADGTALTLPGGALKVAVGVQARREQLSAGGSNFFSTLTPVAQAGADVGRDVTAAYIEARVPLVGPGNRAPGVERLELTLAGRIEHYEIVGSTTDPKIGVLWSPADGVTLRGSYSESFRAPALREVADPAAFVPSLLPQGAARIRSLLLSGGNPDLKPETARSWTAGFDLAPRAWPGVTLSASVFDVNFRDRIDRPVQANIVGALSDPTLTSFVARISPTTSPADLARITALIASPAFNAANGVFPAEAYGAILDNRYVNTAGLRVRGVDASGAWRFPLAGGTAGLSANASYILDYRQQVTPTSAVVDRAGVANFPVKLRSRFTADWSRDRISGLVALNYVGAYHDAIGASIGASTTIDAQLGLASAAQGPLKGVAVTLNVRNLLDRDPPFYNNTAGVGFDPANADPIGRYVSLQLIRTW